MRRRQLIVIGVAALYFSAVIGMAFVPGSALNRQFWCWQVLVFMPVGTLLLVLLGRRRWWAAIAFGMLGAAWIEAGQSVWMPADYASAMDVVWASAGSTAGVLAAFVATSPRRVSVRASVRAHEPHRIVTQAGTREIPQD